MRADEESRGRPGTAARGRPILLVANPASRSGRARERIDRARRALDAAGLAHELALSLPDGATVDLVRRAIDESGFDTVVCLGGDGTFNAVAKGICASRHPGRVRLGMLPSGTANDQGKSFGISAAPSALERNVRVIAEGHTTRLDVAEVRALSDTGVLRRHDLFFDSMGWGLSAAILAFRNRELSRVRRLPVVRDIYKNQMVYVRAAARELALSWLTRDRFSAEITVDGASTTLHGLTDMVISNTMIYAGEWIIDPDSRHDDGQLEVAAFRGTHDWTGKLILNLKRSPLNEKLLRRMGVPTAPLFRGRSIAVEILRPENDRSLPSQLDGEEFAPADRFEIATHRRILTLIVPENFHWI